MGLEALETHMFWEDQEHGKTGKTGWKRASVSQHHHHEGELKTLTQNPIQMGQG